jgi:hypothetical protein
VIARSTTGTLAFAMGQLPLPGIPAPAQIEPVEHTDPICALERRCARLAAAQLRRRERELEDVAAAILARLDREPRFLDLRDAAAMRAWLERPLEGEESCMPVTKENLEDVFTYHAPDDADRIRLLAIRTAGKDLAATILESCPNCADAQAAIRLVREAVMTANAAIMLRGAV